MSNTIVILMAVIAVGILGWGCAHFAGTANPYDAGRAAGTAYLIADETAPREYVRGAELAYDALTVIVNSPADPTPERLKQEIYSIAKDNGYNETLVDNALEAVRIFRRYIDPYLQEAESVQEAVKYLQDFKTGIDDVVKAE